MNRVLRLLLLLTAAALCGSTYGQEVKTKRLPVTVPADSAGTVAVAPAMPPQGSLAPKLNTGAALPGQPGGTSADSGKPKMTRQPAVDRSLPLTVTGAREQSAHTPFSDDYSVSGNIAEWQGGALTGSSAHTTMPALMVTQGAAVGVTQRFGQFTLTGGVSADRYHFIRQGTRTYFGFSGQARYDFSENVSMTVFGHYNTNSRYHSMAAMPYMGGKGYGGYVTFMGETLGLDLGVQREYDVFARRWTTSAIITPKIRFSEKFTLDLPVGWLVTEFIDKAVHKNSYKASPMIAPPVLPMPGPVPFGTPEMPHGY